MELKLQNIYPESATFKAKDLKLKVKKKRPRPKVWRPEKVKMAKRAKTTKLTSNGQRRKYSIFGCMSLMVDGSDYESYFLAFVLVRKYSPEVSRCLSFAHAVSV